MIKPPAGGHVLGGMADLETPLPPMALAAAPPRAPADAAPAARLRRMVDEHYAFLWRSLRRLGVPESGVEDAAQQVLFVAARRMEDVRAGAERAFLFGAAVRVASDARRAQRRRPEDASGAAIDEVPSVAPDPEQALGDREARRVLDEVLDALPEDLRVVLVLFELEELTTAETAEMLGIPIGTVASRLRRAREAFEEAAARVAARMKRGGAR